MRTFFAGRNSAFFEREVFLNEVHEVVFAEPAFGGKLWGNDAFSWYSKKADSGVWLMRQSVSGRISQKKISRDETVVQGHDERILRRDYVFHFLENKKCLREYAVILMSRDLVLDLVAVWPSQVELEVEDLLN